MGQRHQVSNVLVPPGQARLKSHVHQFFAITKTRRRETGYVCVVTFHNQWLYGKRAARSAKMILNAIRTHAALVETELKLLDDPAHEPGFEGGGYTGWEGCHTPTPFLARLMQIAGAVRSSPMPCGVLPGGTSTSTVV